MQGLRPRKIIILSNYTIEQCFERAEDREPMLRRFKVINFPEGKQSARFRSHLQPVVEETPEPVEALPVAFPPGLGIDLPTWEWTGLFDVGQLEPLV